MIANLHTHSYFSDGTETPETVVQLASESGIELLSLTDHNTFAGYERFIAECKRLDMLYVKGVEISTIQHEIDYYSEILAYFPNGGDKQIEPLLERVRLTEKERILRALQLAQEKFKSYDFSYDELYKIVIEDRPLTTMHPHRSFYKYMTSKCIVSSDFHTFDTTTIWKDLLSMKNIEVNDTLFDIIPQIVSCGGFPVLPHFGTHCKHDPSRMIKMEQEYLSQLKQMKDLGLWGIEIHPYKYLPQADDINNIVREWAKKIGLTITYGSDFHGKLSTQNRIAAIVGEFDGFN